MTRKAKIFVFVSLVIIFLVTPVLCQLNRVIEAETITSEAINLYEDESLTMLATETTMDEIEALETKIDDLNGK